MEETGAKGFACRYIDDLFTAGVPLPPQERYGMEYKVTSDNPHSVCSRFLFRKWAGDVRKAELYAFFRNLLQELRNQGTNRPPDPRVPLAPLRPATLTQEYLQVFGYRPDTNQPRPAREVTPLWFLLAQ